MKMHNYFLLNIKHGTSQLYLGPKYNCEAPGRDRGGGWGGAPGEGPLSGTRGEGSNSLAPALNTYTYMRLPFASRAIWSAIFQVLHFQVLLFCGQSFSGAANLAPTLPLSPANLLGCSRCGFSSQQLAHSVSDVVAFDADFDVPSCPLSMAC